MSLEIILAAAFSLIQPAITQQNLSQMPNYLHG
jgi:hypothetical protein